MIRKFFSSLLVLILMPVFLVFLIALSLKFSILNPDFYKTSFQKVDLYSKTTDDAAPALLNSIGEGEEGKGRFGLGPMGADDITKVLQSSISPTWLETQTALTVTQFFGYAYGKTNNLEIIIPLAEIKSSLTQNLNQSLKTKIESLPPCTAEELKNLQLKNNEDGFSFNCLPPGQNLELLEKMVTSSVTGGDGLLTKLPDQYNLGETILKNPGVTENILRFFTIFNLVFKALIIALGMLVFLLTLINHKYLLGALKWLAIPLMISSGIVLTLSLIGHLLAAGLIGGYLTVLPGELKSVATSTAINLIGQLFSKFEIYSGIALGSSIILLIIAIIISKKYPYQIKAKGVK